MTLSIPATLSDSARLFAGKNLLPTALDTAGIRTQIAASVRRQSLFSARTLLEDLLGKYKTGIGDLLAGESDPATARLAIKEYFKSIGVTPSGETGELTDLASDARINLVLKTNVQLAQGAGHLIQQNDPAVLDTFPALELVRFEDRNKPRDWEQRWLEAARDSGDLKAYAALADSGRMVALKNSPIWDSLGSSELFPDGLDNPFPPFAFSSGMWTQDVDWDTAKELGLLDDETEVQPREIDFANLFNTEPA